MMPIEWHRGAIHDAQQGRRFYKRRGGHFAAAYFDASLDEGMARIAEWPLLGSPVDDDTRTIRLKKFPFAVIYYIEMSRILVLAVAHKDRRPGYWHRRRR